MIKFFRKYNKQILAIVTVFLMISFIGGIALQNLMTPSPFREVRAEAFGTPITQGDLNAVRTETRVLDGLGVPWRTPWGFDGSMPPLNELDYLLLMREARRADLRPSLDQARVQLDAANRNLTKFLLDNAISSETLEHAYANFVGVQHAWELARQSMLPSEMEVQQAVRKQHETLNAGIVQIDSQPLIDPQQAVDDDALAEHFEKYKDSLPSNEPLSFGYLVPDRVRVEYVKIQTSDIALNQPVTVSQAERYWRDHQKEFLRPKEEADDADPADPDRPAYHEAFVDAQGDVVARLSGQARLAEAREMAGIVWNALREPWYNAADDGQGFLLAPEVAKQPGYYQELIERVKDRLEHPGTLSTGQTGLFTGRQAEAQELIGQSREDTQGGAPGDAFGSTTHQVQGLVAEAPPGARFLSLYQTAPVWTIDDDDNLYIYRVVEVQKSRPPESLAEVRDQVESDVRALEAFERSAEHARRVLQLAGEGGGLQTAWEAYDGLDPEVKNEVGGWFEAKPFPREMPELLPGLRFPVSVTDKDGARDDDGRLKYQIRSDEFVARVYALQESDGGEALGLIEVAGSGNCFVVQLAGLNHITTEDYPRFKTNILRAIGRSREDRLKREWFSGERIRARAGFKASTPS